MSRVFAEVTTSIPRREARSAPSHASRHLIIVGFCLAWLLGIPSCRSSQSSEPADLVLRGGAVVTVDAARPEAQAIAIAGHQDVRER